MLKINWGRVFLGTILLSLIVFGPMAWMIVSQQIREYHARQAAKANLDIIGQALLEHEKKKSDTSGPDSFK